MPLSPSTVKRLPPSPEKVLAYLRKLDGQLYYTQEICEAVGISDDTLHKYAKNSKEIFAHRAVVTANGHLTIVWGLIKAIKRYK